MPNHRKRSFFNLDIVLLNGYSLSSIKSFNFLSSCHSSLTVYDSRPYFRAFHFSKFKNNSVGAGQSLQVTGILNKPEDVPFLRQWLFVMPGVVWNSHTASRSPFRLQICNGVGRKVCSEVNTLAALCCMRYLAFNAVLWWHLIPFKCWHVMLYALPWILNMMEKKLLSFEVALKSELYTYTRVLLF